MITDFLKKHETKIIISVLALALLIRLINLSFPDWQVFDEIYYYNFARDYLGGFTFFDVHPPLGKLFISLGLFIFKNSLFGARIFEAIAGTAIIYLLYLVSKNLFKNILLAMIVMVLAFFETSLYVESRFSLLNIFIVLFNLLSYLYFIKWTRKNNFKHFYLTILFLSLATSIKWTGIFNLPVFALVVLISPQLRKNIFAYFSSQTLLRIFYCIIILFVPYFALFFNEYVHHVNIFFWHRQAYDFHKNLVSHHPYAARWYTWFFMIRPIWLEFRTMLDGNLVGIIEIGNPFIIITGTISIFYALYRYLKTRSIPLLIVLTAIVINTLPWIFIKRESFYYHFIVILPFIIICAGYLLHDIAIKFKLQKITLLILALSIGFFIWFWPLLNGNPIPYESYNNRIIINSWR